MENGTPEATGTGSAHTQPVRLMLSCDNCRKKKIRCNGGKPNCASCNRTSTPCHYSPVGPRRKPRKSSPPPALLMDLANKSVRHRNKRRASSLQLSDGESRLGMDSQGLGSVSHIMLERLKETETLEPPMSVSGPMRDDQVMEMLRLQTQISCLVNQLRNITIRVSGLTPAAGSPIGEQMTGGAQAARSVFGGFDANSEPRTSDQFHGEPSTPQQPSQDESRADSHGKESPQPDDVHMKSHGEAAKGISVSRDLINHLTSVYFQYCHASETGMYPQELYRDRLQRAQVSEPFLLSVLAVASRFSDDPRVQREPAYLAGYDFYERVTRHLMMDVLERDCIENMLTLNNLAVYAVGLPVANRGWYFSGLAMRMATQMSLQKVDAPGRMPGASMMSGPGIESARRAFWTTLLLEALASFASGEPPPITIQDIHVAEPFDDTSSLGDSSRGFCASAESANAAGAPESDDVSMHDQSSSPMTGPSGCRTRSGTNQSGGSGGNGRPSVCAYITQLAMLLIRVARLNGNRHPESAQFSPEYAALHSEMVAWYHGLPDNMQIKPTIAKEEIQREPKLFAAKMFVHCHYHAAIIALHQPRVDLVRVDASRGGESGNRFSGRQSKSPDEQWRQLAQQQCLTAACTMTELLTLARNLDVRYHIVTFGFAVFMAGVVHVGAVNYTPRQSNERQYSINCVKEHVRCLDRLGKYFAFHFIMAKHIRAQLQVIEAADLRRQNTMSGAPAVVPAAGMGSMDILGLDPRSRLQHGSEMAAAAVAAAAVSGMQFDFAAAFGIHPQFGPGMVSAAVSTAPPLSATNSLPNIDISDIGLGAGLMGFGPSGNVVQSSGNGMGAANPWLYSSTSGISSMGANPAASSGLPAASGTPISGPAGSSSMDMFLGLFSAVPSNPSSGPSSQNVAQCPVPGVCGGLCGTHSPATTASMAMSLQGLSGMAGLGSGISSLAQLFSSSEASSIYPENIVSNSSLAPSKNGIGGGQGMTSSSEAPNASAYQADPAAPLRLTLP
ncbi:hypothetical protein GGF37_001714, partial [Kickxella alabastrina]